MKMMKLWMLVVVATIASACSKQDDAGFEGAATKTVQFIANDAAGRTIFGEPEEGVYPVLWQEGDQIKVNLNLDIKESGTGRVVLGGGSPTVTPCNGGAEATFGLKLTGEDGAAYENEAEYTFYAISPASMWSHSNDAESSKNLFRLEIPAEQAMQVMPNGGRSCAAQAQVLYGKSEPITKLSAPVALAFKHVAAYGCITLKHMPESVIAVELSSSENIAGRFFYEIGEGEISFNKSGLSQSITVTNFSNEVWFGMIPTDLSGKELTIKLTTANGDTYTKTITFANGDGNFQAGRIAKFAVNFAEVEKDVVVEPFELYEVYKENGVAQGVVFWVSEDGQTAKIVHLNRTQEKIMWSKDQAKVGLYGTDTYPDGLANTGKLREHYKDDLTKCPMLGYLNTLNANGDTWYWPSIKELQALNLAYEGVTETMTWDELTAARQNPSALPDARRTAQIAFDKLLIENGGVAMNTRADGPAGGEVGNEEDTAKGGCSYWASSESKDGTKGNAMRFGSAYVDGKAKNTENSYYYGRAVKVVTK